MKLGKITGFVALTYSILGLVSEYSKNIFQKSVKLHSSVFLGIGVKLRSEIEEALQNSSYIFAIHGNGFAPVSCSQEQSYWSPVKYIYPGIKNDGSFYSLCHQNSDLLEGIKLLSKNHDNSIEQPISFEIFNVELDNDKRIRNFDNSIIITHVPSIQKSISAIVDEVVLNSLLEFHSNDLRRFITSYLISPNYHSFNIINKNLEQESFRLTLTGCSKDEIKENQNKITSRFLDFALDSNITKLFGEESFVEISTKEETKSYPKWYIEIQNKYISKVQEYILLNAIIENNVGLLICLKSEVDLNVQLKNGVTPLMIASVNNHQDIVKLLVSDGADCNLSKNNGITPLMTAANFGFEEITSILLSCTRLNNQDDFGNTALTYAIRSGSLSVISMILLTMLEYNNELSLESYFSACSEEICSNICTEILKQSYFLGVCTKYYPAYSAQEKVYYSILADECIEILY